MGVGHRLCALPCVNLVRLAPQVITTNAIGACLTGTCRCKGLINIWAISCVACTRVTTPLCIKFRRLRSKRYRVSGLQILRRGRLRPRNLEAIELGLLCHRATRLFRLSRNGKPHLGQADCLLLKRQLTSSCARANRRTARFQEDDVQFPLRVQDQGRDKMTLRDAVRSVQPIRTMDKQKSPATCFTLRTLARKKVSTFGA